MLQPNMLRPANIFGDETAGTGVPPPSLTHGPAETHPTGNAGLDPSVASWLAQRNAAGLAWPSWMPGAGVPQVSLENGSAQTSTTGDANSQFQQLLNLLRNSGISLTGDQSNLLMQAFGAPRGGNAGEGGNANAGQPGSAGVGPEKTAIDAIVGGVGGMLAPGFGALRTGIQALLDPNFDVMNSLSFGLFGQPNTNFPGIITDPNLIANMSINPGAYGMEHGPVSTLSADENAAAKAAATMGGIGFGGTGDAGSGVGFGGGLSDQGGTSGTVGGENAGAKGAATGTDSSGFRFGGLVRGRGGPDSQNVRVTPNEYVLVSPATRLLGEQNLNAINKIARAAGNDEQKRSQIRMVLRRIGAAKTPYMLSSVGQNPFA